MRVAHKTADEPPSPAPAPARVARACRDCVFFRNDAAYLERAIEGLRVMSSGYASVRAEDGVCLRHDRYLSAWASCGEFQARQSKP